jgi:hypothetical protein
MKLATEHVRRMSGSSQSHLMRCDDGYYVTKFMNNPQHLRTLANEMLASRLAARMGICVPQMDVVEVWASLIESTPDLSIENSAGRTPCSAGRQFGSKFPGDPRSTRVYDFLPDSDLGRVCNLEDFRGAYVLDKWTCNTDRRQAIFVRQSIATSGDWPDSSYRAMMIDYGYCFNGGEWDFHDAPLHGLYRKRCVYECVTGLESFDQWLNYVETEVTLSSLYQDAQQVPSEWLGGSREILNRLIERLYARRRRVRDLIRSAQKIVPDAFPNWRKVFTPYRRLAARGQCILD